MHTPSVNVKFKQSCLLLNRLSSLDCLFEIRRELKVKCHQIFVLKSTEYLSCYAKRWLSSLRLLGAHTSYILNILSGKWTKSKTNRQWNVARNEKPDDSCGLWDLARPCTCFYVQRVWCLCAMLESAYSLDADTSVRSRRTSSFRKRSPWTCIRCWTRAWFRLVVRRRKPDSLLYEVCLECSSLCSDSTTYAK